MAPRKPTNRDEEEMTSLRVDEQSAARREAMPASAGPQLTGIIGDQSPEAGESRSGEDTRRRGWYWNWNTMVTQFAPLIGLDGKGLLDSYIVWTDRREDSPFRGYAFPSTTAEANFYGIDRNVLGTINKILVALDLIEIRKSMVHRPDERGNDWKFPHNTYRVKDHGDNFQLTAEGVRRVVQLATEDTAVYRRIKHIFGSKFQPIDPNSVWHGIIAELEPTPNWQKLQALALADEQRTSERSRKGHAARKKSEGTETPATIGQITGKAIQSVPTRSNVSTVPPVANDSGIDSAVATESPAKSTAASTSKGLDTSAAQSSNASGVQTSSDAVPASIGYHTIADTTSTTNYEHQTTTTTDDKDAQNRSIGTNVQQADLFNDFRGGPDDSRDRELTLRLFDEANEKPPTIAARKLLGKIASDFADVAQLNSLSGWSLVGVAIEEAVSSGSSFVAPKRVREILQRWRKDGVPEMYGGTPHDHASQTATIPVTSGGDDSQRSVRTESVISTSAEAQSIWREALDQLGKDKRIAEALHTQLASDAILDRIEAGNAVVRVSDRLQAILLPDLQKVIQTKISVAAKKPLYLKLETSTSVSRAFVESVPMTATTGPFAVADTGLNSDQFWQTVQQALAGGDIPAAELTMWATNSQLLAFDGETFVLGFSGGFHCRRAEHRRSALEREFAYVAGFSCRLEIVEIDTWRTEHRRREA